MIYFDHAATTPVHPEVFEAMIPYFQKKFGNPSSSHRLGKEALQGVEDARQRMAGLIGANADEIVFTSGGTEANNMALLGTAYNLWEKGKHIITTAIEHQAVLAPCRFLEKQGFEVTYLTVDDSGLLEPSEVTRALRPDTIMISVMHANNEIGTIQPVEEIGAIARERGVIFHCDAVQTAGKIPVNVDQMNCDLLSISGHKIYGPKGVGCLYIRHDCQIVPMILGGSHESQRRAGTENVPGIVGLGQAASLAQRDMEKKTWELAFLRDRIIDGIMEKIGGCILNGDRLQRLPGHVSVSFNGIKSQDLLSLLDEKGIAASGGSACHAVSPEPSHVLKAMGYDDELANSALRITLGRDNQDKEVDYLLAILPDIVSMLRDVSPVFQKHKPGVVTEDQSPSAHI